ncbi:phosphohydrolase [Gordonia spumicola]|uniref:Phosphohydrolase n=1 Tax=Gordonia spumicola TaxID=589161 RepID=A0A7I9V8K6_9ACTN|nr:HD domain-containing protein [Gordonia spumicola]GEE01572.1 phosphohydrolase [Gordonia spumicola]
MSELPDSPLVRAAFDHVSAHLHEAILNHSVRVARLATAIGESEQLELDPDSIWVASLFHDFGTVAGAASGDRFEVVGGNEAAAFLERLSFADQHEAQEIWDAIALHTSPHISESRGGLTRAIRLGVLMDFGEDVLENSASIRARLETMRPRLNIEIELADLVVSQVLDRPEKAPRPSWPRDLYESYLQDPGYRGVNRGF